MIFWKQSIVNKYVMSVEKIISVLGWGELIAVCHFPYVKKKTIAKLDPWFELEFLVKENM